MKYTLMIIVLMLLTVGLPTSLRASDHDTIVLERVRQMDGKIDPENGLPWGTHGVAKGYHSNFDKGTKVHPTRAAIGYAALLIASPNREHQAQGNKMLDKVIALQDQDPKSRTFGIWPWYAEEPLSAMAAPDYNWADFQGAELVVILHDYPDRLTDEIKTKAEKSLEYACQAIIKRNVGPGYTNISMMGATVTAAAGELLDRPDFLEYGRKRIRRNWDHFNEVGGFNEYNSPCYTMIVIKELERMLRFVKDADCRTDARRLFEAAATTIAEHYHVPTGQWSGPFSRTYSDYLGERDRQSLLRRAGLVPESVTEFDEIFVPFIPFAESLRPYFRDIPKKPRERHDVFAKGRPGCEENGTTWMDAEASLGSVSYHSFWEQARGLIGYWTVPGAAPAVLRLRFMHDDQDFASAWGRHRQSGPRIVSTIGLIRNWGSMHPSFDRPKNGVFKGKSFRIVYQLATKGATVKQRDACRFELSAGPIAAVIHVAENSSFNGKPIVWRTEQEDGKAMLVGICYEGEPKEFEIPKLDDFRIAAGLELLRKGEKPSDVPIVFSDSDFETKNEGKFYGTAWPGVIDGKPLLSPLRPTNR